MKYEEEIIINKPVKEVIDLFDSEEHLYEWQEGLEKIEHLSGEKREVGAKMKLFFRMGNRRLEMTETITKKNLPDIFEGSYQTNGIFNIVRNSFSETKEGHTLWKTENEFHFGGFMKLFSWFSPGTFKKQTFKIMEQFKHFAENYNP